MEVLGITYLIENAQQFWSELDEILNFPVDASLSQLDTGLRRFVSFCATYHDSYLSSPLQLEHACELLLQSELFSFHSERMSEHLLVDAESTTDPHAQYILYNILLLFGRRNSNSSNQRQNLLRARRKWEPLIPLLMDHARLEYDAEEEEDARALEVPVEAKLRYLAFCLLYEVCRVQKFSMSDLRIFDNEFIDYLFDLIERTRNMQDESLNYAIIKLIVALNEQFMVAALQPHSPDPVSNGHHHHKPHHDASEKSANRILQVLMRRLNVSQTFGENMIFMLNRAQRTPEDLCMQLLVLKLLYLLFTTKGTEEYFYTNDLCVLVDVFLRELVDLDEESESLRHTYLRVLHPLLTRTQLRSVPYKRPQIVRTLESLIANPTIRDISPTTHRLVSRCLSGDWCVQLRKPTGPPVVVVSAPGGDKDGMQTRGGSPSNDSVASAAAAGTRGSLSADRPKMRSLKSSKSVENFKAPSNVGGSGSGGKSHPHERRLDTVLRSSNESSLSLVGATAPSMHPVVRRRERSQTNEFEAVSVTVLNPAPSSTTKHSSLDAVVGNVLSPVPLHPSSSAGRMATISTTSLPAPSAASRGSPTESVVSSTGSPTAAHRRPAPPTPPKRRKPPAIPAGRTTNGNGTMTTIAASTPSPTPSPLSRVVTSHT